MLILQETSQFRKDLKTIRKRGYSLNLLENVIQMLIEERPLDSSLHDHALSGDYIGFRECHIQADWLLIYMIQREKLILTAARTGTHSDVF